MKILTPAENFIIKKTYMSYGKITVPWLMRKLKISHEKAVRIKKHFEEKMESIDLNNA